MTLDPFNPLEPQSRTLRMLDALKLHRIVPEPEVIRATVAKASALDRNQIQGGRGLTPRR